MNQSLMGPTSLEPALWVHISLLSALCLVILILNSCVVVAIAKHLPIRTGSNMLILSLAVADVCIAVFVIPGHISRNFSEKVMGNVICIFCAYGSSVSMAAAALSLCGISLARVRSVAYPLKPKLSKTQAGYILGGIWVVALVYGLRGGMNYSLRDVTFTNGVNVTICTMSSTDEVINYSLAALELVLIYIIPSFVVGISYAVILYLISRHNKRMRQHASPSNNNNNNNNNNIQKSNNIHMKAVRMSIMVVSIFVVCHLPANIAMMYVSSGAELIPEIVILIRAFYLIAFLNSVLNPIFYGFLNPKIRCGITGVFCSCSNCRQRQ